MKSLNATRTPYWGCYKLEAHEVLHLRMIARAVPDIPREELASRFQISESHVSNLIHGRFWETVR